MNFQRGNDPMETLKLGRRANAVKVKYFEIRAEVVVSLIPEKMSNEMRVKYNIPIGSHHMKFTENFIISENILIIALVILKRDGICIDFHNYIRELAGQKFYEKTKTYYDKFPIRDEIPEIKIKWITIFSENDNRFALTFSQTGKDLLYKNELYRIAPPKDGKFLNNGLINGRNNDTGYF
jgi:hypothetical protein